jgi:hypothetical protein
MSHSKNTSHVFGSVEIMSHQDLNNSRISGLGLPISPNDAASKIYVDNSIIGSNLIGGVGITVNTSTNTISINPSQTTITTLGTIQNGTWNGNNIQISYGGTGVSSFSPSKFIYYNGTNQLVSSEELSLSSNKITSSTPIFISNTTDTVNSLSTIGSLIVSGGVNITKQLYVGGNVRIAGNITVGNIFINGNISLLNINASNASFTSISSSSLNSNTINLVSYIVTPLTSTSNLITTNSSISNISSINNSFSNAIITNGLITGSLNVSGVSIFSTLNSTNISSTNLLSSNATSNNLVSTNISTGVLRVNNGILLNSVITSGTISNLNIPTLLSGLGANIINLTNTNGNILNITNNNLLTTNSTITNGLFTNSSIHNLSVNNTVNSNVISSSNIYTSNLSNTNLNNINSTITNIVNTFSTIGTLRVSGNANLENVNVTNLTTSSLFVNNLLTSTYNLFTGVTINNLNVIGPAIFTTSISLSTTTGTLYSNISVNNNSSIGTLNVSDNINNSTGTIFTLNITTSNLYAINTISRNMLITNLSTGILNVSNITNTLNLNNTNQTTTNLNNTNQTTTNLLNTNISSSNIKITTSSIGNSYIVNNSVANTNIINSTLSNLVVNTNATFYKNLSLVSSYQGGVTNTAGSFFNIFASTYTNNITNSGGNVNAWYANYIASSTLVASNNSITTNKSTNLYIESNVTLGPNQTINYNSGLLLGYVTNTTGGNLNTQISFERSDGNAFGGIYTENATNKLVIINSSLSGGSGLGMYTVKNTPVIYSSIPSSTNITPTPYIQFLNSSTNFYSTVDSNNTTSGSLILAGGLGVSKNISSNTINTNNLNVDGNITINNGYFTNTGYLLDSLNTNSYPIGISDLIFSNVPDINSRISVSNLGIITFQDPGVYQLNLKLHSNTTVSTTTLLQTNVNLFTSGNWVISQSSSLNTIYDINTDFNSLFMLYVNSGQECKITLNNGHTTNFEFDTNIIWSRLMINRIG